MSLEQLTDDLRVFAEERNWDRFHSPRNFSIALFSEVGELLAPYTWVNDAEAAVLHHQADHHSAIRSEVGDVMINIVQFCRLAGIDVTTLGRGCEPFTVSNPKDVAMRLSLEAANLMARFTGLDEWMTDVSNRHPEIGRGRQMETISQLYVESQVFCQLVEIDPLAAANAKLAKLRERFPVEEQLAAGGYVRRGEDGTPRESIRR